MINLSFNFAHPFKGKLVLRQLDSSQACVGHLKFDSNGCNDFEIPLEIKEDGQYRVMLDWEYEGRDFFHQSDILIRAGKLIDR